MKNKNTALVVLGLVVVLVVGVCWWQRASLVPGELVVPPPEVTKVTVGAVLPLTGGASFLGEEERKGIEAMREVLQTDELAIEVVYADSANDASTGLSAFLKLTNVDQVAGAVITHSGVNGPISEYISGQKDAQKEMPLPIGTIVASTKITRNNDIFLRVYPSGRDEAAAMASYAIDTLDLSRVAIAYQNDDYGLDGNEQFTASFQEAGRAIVFADAFDKGITDQRALVTKLLAVEPDGVYVLGNTPAYATVIRQLDEAGFEGSLLSGSAMDVGSLRTAVGDPALEGLVYTSTFSESDSVAIEEDYVAYKAALANEGTTPNMLNIYAGVSFQIMVDVLTQDGIEDTVTATAKAGATTFDTVLGPISFNDNRDALLPVFVKRVADSNAANDELLAVVQTGL